MSLEETLKYNKEKVRLFREVELKKIKKQQRKEKILATFIGIVIIGMMVIILNSYNKVQLKRCVQAGNSVNYCKEGM